MEKGLSRETASIIRLFVLTTLLLGCHASSAQDKVYPEQRQYGGTTHSQPASPATQVMLQFPDTSVGRLYLLAANDAVKTIGKGINARGTVSLPKGYKYRLVLGGVEKTGCQFLDNLPPDSIGCIDTRSSISITDDCIRRLGHLTALRAIILDNTEVSGHALSSLSRCKNIETFSAGGTAITGAGLATICQFPKLHTLSLAYTKLTDRSLAKLQVLQYLRDLKISYTGVTSLGVINLAPLTTLRQLDLSGNIGVDDRIAKVVSKLPHLRRLNLDRTKITKGTIEALRQAQELNKLVISEQKGISSAAIKALLPHCVVEIKGSGIEEEMFAPLK
jgi:hypothetical protein